MQSAKGNAHLALHILKFLACSLASVWCHRAGVRLSMAPELGGKCLDCAHVHDQLPTTPRAAYRYPAAKMRNGQVVFTESHLANHPEPNCCLQHFIFVLVCLNLPYS
jgi:hypothetical protein